MKRWTIGLMALCLAGILAACGTTDTGSKPGSLAFPEGAAAAFAKLRFAEGPVTVETEQAIACVEEHVDLPKRTSNWLAQKMESSNRQEGVLLYAEFDGTGRCFAVDGGGQILYEFRDGQMERSWSEDPIAFLRSMYGLPAEKTLKDEGKICFHEEKNYDVVSVGTGSGADFTAEFSYYIEEDRSAIYLFNIETDALEQIA